MATATLSYNLKTLIGDNFDPRRTRVWVSMNVPLITVGGTELRPDDLPTSTPASDGTGSFTLVTTNSATNPTTFAYIFHIDYTTKGSRGQRKQWTSSEFPFTLSTNIASISEAFDGLAINPTWQSDFRDEMDVLRADVIDISGIAVPDDVVEALLKGTAGAGPLTRAAVDEKFRVETGGPALRHLNLWQTFFDSKDSVGNPAIWANPSHLNSTGLTQWANYITANAGITAGSKVVWFGDSWISQDPTILSAATTAVGATAVVSGVGGNTSTMMLARFDADVAASHSDADYVIFNEPGVNDVYQGFTPAQVAANLAALVAKIRGIGAVPIYTGMVPLSEHGVPSATRYAETKAQIGDGKKYPAVPAEAALVPARPEADSIGIYGGLPRVIAGVENTTLGARAGAAITDGSRNTLVGREAGTVITTATDNTGIGQNSLRANVSGVRNTALGQSALSAATTTDNTAVGQQAGVLVSTGASNTFVGQAAGYNVNGDTAKATTTGSFNTSLGYRSGCSAGASYGTAVGALATASGAWSTALGSATTATHTGSVAIGRDASGNGATTTANNDFVLGTTAHQVRVPGRFTTAASATAQAGFNVPHGAAPTTPTNGDIWTTTAGLFVRINGVTRTVTVT